MQLARPWPQPLPSAGHFRRLGTASNQEFTMRPSVALEANRIAMQRAARKFNTANLRVFGSALRGADREGSDLDLIVDPLPGAILLDLGGLQIELESLLGVRVDLLTPGDLPLKFRDEVLSQALPV
jgi:uncharacterized protein